MPLVLLPAISLALSPMVEVQGRPVSSEAPVGIIEARPVPIVLRGWDPKREVTIFTLRSIAKSVREGESWVRRDVRLLAWAKARPNADGSIDLDRAHLFGASNSRTGSAGLFWSGYELADRRIPPSLRDLGDRTVTGEGLIGARQGEGASMREVAGPFRFGIPSSVRFETVDEPGLNGVFAYPVGAEKHAAMISLHGSEGGSEGSARLRALMLAANGFPTLAVNYYAQPYQNLPSVPKTNLRTPIEGLELARVWLAKRAEVDGSRLGVIGVSKGAEFSLVGASTYPWIRAVVAVVPSDAVWEGFPVEKREEADSTWSYGGKSLPYIPLYPYVEGLYRINTDRYERSRRDHPREAKAAEIRIERSSARFLLLGSDRDEVWASGAMIRRLRERMRRAGRDRQLESTIYPKAGHQISGPGLFPVRLYGVQGKDPRDKSLDAEGEATVDAWRRTVEFLRRAL